MPSSQAELEELPESKVVRQKQAFWESISVEYLQLLGRHTNMLNFHHVLDVHKIGLCDARWLISQKRTTNLSDIFNKLKQKALILRSGPFTDILSLRELVEEVIPDTGYEHVPDFEDMQVDA
jgi:hypothetical protein